MVKPFVREQRYLVVKITDAINILSRDERETLAHLIQKINDIRKDVLLKKPLNCLVIENDWPEYELAWKSIEARVSSSYEKGEQQ